ncbi:ATP-binding protein [Microscilla marina]|uniref:AAA superfamily ATPase, putative n=1 Tax=Microscilla marina ATCC 23134 TaxID=313606 RepID=A1ZNJ2_MICM2|nr:AAA family ATPase [Microscilla marina]EAY28103.1 AAA superfamily ATPase, putative [Microscilla marina ATCC 23134]
MAELDFPSDDFENDNENLSEEALQQKIFREIIQQGSPSKAEEKRLGQIQTYFGHMVMDTEGVKEASLEAVYKELNWFLQVLWLRYVNKDSKVDFKSFFAQPDFKGVAVKLPELPAKSHYKAWLQKHQLTEKAPERLLMAMVMALSLNDALFFAFIELLQQPIVAVFVGGQTKDSERRFMPTMQTLFYLLAGVDLKNQAAYQLRFRKQNHHLGKWGIELGSAQAKMTGRPDLADEWKNLLISLNPNIWQYFLGGNMPLPEENKDLPITKLDTPLTFDDLVLNDETKNALTPLLNYARNGKDFFNDAEASGHFKSGYISLLQGPPGTGKTLIATVIGKEVGLVTYQLELAQVVSKYIGETSKNINKVFEELTRAIDHLKGEPSILFIDEADALIGKRSEVNDSKDRYANFDVSNLLQKIESFPGLIILASNFQQNLDSAIQRRIGATILVPPPEADERTQLWKNYRPANLEYPTDNFARILGEKFRLTGAQINNIMKQVALAVYGTKVKVLDYDLHMEPAIKSELIKFDEVYVRPRDLMNEAQVDEEEYLQQLLWERALPPKWQYNPLYMPRILSQAVVLTEEDIKALVKKVKRRWEGGPYHDIPFKEGIEVVLRDLCAVKNLNWNEIQAKIYQLLEEEKAKSNKEAEQKSSRTVQLVDLSKLKDMGKKKEEKEAAEKEEAPQKKSTQKKLPKKKLTKEEQAAQEKLRKAAEEKAKKAAAKEEEERKLKKILSPSEAEKFWATPLPQGFAFARKDMVKNMAQIYTLSKWYIIQIVEKAAELAKADESHETKANGDIEIRASHLQGAMDVVAAELGKAKGEKLDRDHFLRQDLKEQRQKEKAKEAKRRDVVPGWKTAPRYWANAVPEGYAYSRRDLSSNLAKFYPNISVGAMEDILKQATEFIGKDQPPLIAYSEHILKAIEKYGLQ